MKDEPGPYGPHLLFEEQARPCGYAPRILLPAGEFRDEKSGLLAFVGCKDGSIWSISWPDEERSGVLVQEVEVSNGRGVQKPAVAAMARWNEHKLLVARRGSESEVLYLDANLRSATRQRWSDFVDPEVPLGASIQHIVNLSESTDGKPSTFGFSDIGGRLWTAVSNGSKLSNFRELSTSDVQGSSSGEDRPLFIFPLILTSGGIGAQTQWLLLTRSGRVYYWLREGSNNGLRHLSNALWGDDSDRRRPGLISSIAILPPKPRPVAPDGSVLSSSSVILSTDRGLYEGWLRPSGTFDIPVAFEHYRLSLSGLHAVPSVLATVTIDAGFEFLWVSDFGGDSHLYWGGGATDSKSGASQLRRSGVLHPRSEVMAAAVVKTKDPNTFFVIQLRRDDRVVVHRYRVAGGSRPSTLLSIPSPDETATLRKLLALGTFASQRSGGTASAADLTVEGYLEQRPSVETAELRRCLDLSIPQTPDALKESILLNELFEFLAEDETRRTLVLEALRGPYCEPARSALLRLSQIENLERFNPSPDSVHPISPRLWTLSLLGIIHRRRGDQTDSYLGLLRWLRHRHSELSSDPTRSLSKAGVLQSLETCLALAVKWGLKGGVNRARRNLIMPRLLLEGQIRELEDDRSRHSQPDRHRESANATKASVSTAQVARESPRDAEIERLRLEALTFRTELFARCVNREAEDTKGTLRGRTAWATSFLEVDDKSAKSGLLAVSWRWGGIELFEVDRIKAPSTGELRFLAGYDAGRWTVAENRRNPSDLEQARAGYSRFIILDYFEEDGQRINFLVWAPVDQAESMSAQSRPREPGETSKGPFLHFFSWTGGLADLRGKLEALQGRDACQHLSSAPSPVEFGSRGIYSLVHLGKGQFVAGLSGRNQTPELAFFELTRQEDEIGIRKPTLQLLGMAQTLEAIGESTTSAARPRADPEASAKTLHGRLVVADDRNRTWSVIPIRSGDHAVASLAVGCDSGDILRVDFDWAQQRIVGEVRRVGRLGSAVYRLTSSRAASSDSRSALRIFAGCEDGSIVAFQQLLPETNNLPKSDDSSPALPKNSEGPEEYCSLWATTELAAISGLHVLNTSGGTIPQRFLLAISRNGRYTLFDDTDQVFSPSESPISTEKGALPPRSRSAVPGARMGRRSLGASAFATALLSGDLAAVHSEPSVPSSRLNSIAALAVCTADGVVLLLTLHFPEFTDARKAEHLDIVRDWQAIVAKSRLRFRLTEAIYRDAPTLSMISVRYILGSISDRELRQQTEVTLKDLAERYSWCLPRHLRPLLLLRKLFDDVDKGNVDAADFECPLRQILERAWRLNDFELFKEHCQVVLRRLNGMVAFTFEPYPKNRSAERENCVWDVFRTVVRTMERELEHWVGADDDRDAKVRMTVAKNFVDGRTALALFDAARRPHAQGRCAETILKERLRVVRELLNKRHPLVSLESLRAANLSLTRMGRELVRRRPALYLPVETPLESMPMELGWNLVEEYFFDFATAARRFHRNGASTGDALNHEFERVFALFVCVAPSATLRIAAGLTEEGLLHPTRLGLTEHVRDQLRVLAAIGLPCPPWAEELFELGTRAPALGWGPRLSDFPALVEAGVLTTDPEDGDRVILEPSARLGDENKKYLDGMKILWRILRGLEKVTEFFDGKRRERFPLEGARKSLKDEIRMSDSSAVGDVGARLEGHTERFQESHAFWSRSMEILATSLLVAQARPSAAGETQPQTDAYSLPGSGLGAIELIGDVVQSRAWCAWARSQQQEIRQAALEGRLFEPEVTMYSRVLAALEAAATNFPQGSVVQAILVEKILGHHLLEDLDDHVLNLEELAEVLDPLAVRSFRSNERRILSPPTTEGKGESIQRPMDTTSVFAHELLARAASAESIPSDLRELLILSGTRAEAFSSSQGSNESILEAALQSFAKLARAIPTSPNEVRSIPSVEQSLLRVAVKALHSNADLYGCPDREETPRTVCYERTVGELTSIALKSFFSLSEAHRGHENYERLRKAEGRNRCILLPPLESPGPRSSGTGLYLANLAVVMAGWDLELQISAPTRVGAKKLEVAELTVLLLATRKVADSNGASDGWR